LKTKNLLRVKKKRKKKVVGRAQFFDRLKSFQLRVAPQVLSSGDRPNLTRGMKSNANNAKDFMDATYRSDQKTRL
jgi:hypothetical protein